MPATSIHTWSPGRVRQMRGFLAELAYEMGFEHMAEDLASEVIADWLQDPDGGQGVDTTRCLMTALKRMQGQGEIIAWRKFRYFADLKIFADDSDLEEWQPTRDDGFVDAGVLRQISCALERLEPRYRRAFASTYLAGGAGTKTAERAAGKVRKHLEKAFELELPTGRQGALKPKLAELMRSGRARDIRASRKIRTSIP